MTTPQRNHYPGSIHHVYNRGMKKMTLFRNEKDYERFYQKILQFREKYPVEILAWSLMPNHFHLVIREPENKSDILGRAMISQFMQQIQNSYSRYFSIKYNFPDKVFQGKFKSKHIDSTEYLLQAIHYVHRQATHHLDYDNDEEWPYSSLGQYLQKSEKKTLAFIDDNLVSINDYPRLFQEFKKDLTDDFLDDLE